MIDKLLDQLKQIRNTPLLSPQRKQAMRKNLLAHMTFNAPQRSAWQWLAARLNARLFSRPLSIVLASIILLVIAGVGTATAANNALPGQALYPIKTKINEPIRAVLTIQLADRAVYETDLAAKRMEEVEVLANQGHLDEATQTELTAEFTQHVQKVQTTAQQAPTEHFDEVQTLLDEAKTKLANHEYNAAAELGRQASAAARNRGNSDHDKSLNPSVKGQSTSRGHNGNGSEDNQD